MPALKRVKIGLIEAVLLALAVRDGETQPYKAMEILCGGDQACRKAGFSAAWIAARSLVRKGYATWANINGKRIIKPTQRAWEALEPYYSLCGILCETEPRDATGQQ